MKPQEFIDKWLGWAKNKEEINDEILADLDAMNQALRIHDVVGQSEQLKAFLSYIQQSQKECEAIVNNDEFINGYLKSL